jgi:hypothetical protein
VEVRQIHEAAAGLKLQKPDAAPALAARIPAPEANAAPKTIPAQARGAAPALPAQDTPVLVAPSSLRTLDGYRPDAKPSFLSKWAVRLGLANQTN